MLIGTPRQLLHHLARQKEKTKEPKGYKNQAKVTKCIALINWPFFPLQDVVLRLLEHLKPCDATPNCHLFFWQGTTRARAETYLHKLLDRHFDARPVTVLSWTVTEDHIQAPCCPWHSKECLNTLKCFKGEIPELLNNNACNKAKVTEGHGCHVWPTH